MCLMKVMDKVTFVTEAAGQAYKQTAKFVYIVGQLCARMLTLLSRINRRVLLLLGNPRLRRYGLSLYD